MKGSFAFGLVLVATQAFAAESSTSLESEFDRQALTPSLEDELEQMPIAIHSQYFYRPEEKQSNVILKYGTSDNNFTQSSYYSIFNVEAKTTSYDFAFERGFGNRVSAQLSSGYAKTDFSTNGQRTGTASGLKNITADVSRTDAYQSVKLVYGLGLDYSPTDAVEAGSNTNGNQFTGRDTLTPYIGTETDVDKGVVGGRIWSNVYTHQWIRGVSGGTTRIEKEDPSLFAEAFYEFAIYAKAKIDVLAHVGRDQRIYDRDGQIVDIYGAGVAAYIPVLENMTVIGTVSSDTSDHQFYNTNTSVGLSLRKNL